MPTGSIERSRNRNAARPLAGFLSWIASLWPGLQRPVKTLREDEMPDWLKRDIGWRDGPAERSRAVVEGWERPPARRPGKSR